MTVSVSDHFAVFTMQAAKQSAPAGEDGSTGPAEPTAEQVRAELVPLLLAASAKRQKQQKKHQGTGTTHNLAAITMLCMQLGYENRAINFMPALFAECPQQVSSPGIVLTSSWLSYRYQLQQHNISGSYSQDR
jgi:hypothetical protein